MINPKFRLESLLLLGLTSINFSTLPFTLPHVTGGDDDDDDPNDNITDSSLHPINYSPLPKLDDIILPDNVYHSKKAETNITKPTKCRHKVKLARKANLKRINNHK